MLPESDRSPEYASRILTTNYLSDTEKLAEIILQIKESLDSVLASCTFDAFQYYSSIQDPKNQSILGLLDHFNLQTETEFSDIQKKSGDCFFFSTKMYNDLVSRGVISSFAGRFPSSTRFKDIKQRNYIGIEHLALVIHISTPQRSSLLFVNPGSFKSNIRILEKDSEKRIGDRVSKVVSVDGRGFKLVSTDTKKPTESISSEYSYIFDPQSEIMLARQRLLRFRRDLSMMTHRPVNTILPINKNYYQIRYVHKTNSFVFTSNLKIQTNLIQDQVINFSNVSELSRNQRRTLQQIFGNNILEQVCTFHNKINSLPDNFWLG